MNRKIFLKADLGAILDEARKADDPGDYWLRGSIAPNRLPPILRDDVKDLFRGTELSSETSRR